MALIVKPLISTTPGDSIIPRATNSRCLSVLDSNWWIAIAGC